MQCNQKNDEKKKNINWDMVLFKQRQILKT